MPRERDKIPDSIFRILAVTQGQWGERIADHIRDGAPLDWQATAWSAPRILPPVIDDPEDFLPPDLPFADLILSLGEVPGVAQLIPDIARLTGARAVIAPIDRNPSLPLGLARQLSGWLSDMGVACVFPKPFCSLTEKSYNRVPLVQKYDDSLIRRFAKVFGKPEFRLTVEEGQIKEVNLVRDSACGCAEFVAKNLVGVPVEQALEQAGLQHHHFPCLASMERDPDYRDTLMHVSGNFLKDTIREQIKDHLSALYLRPQGWIDQVSNKGDR